MCSGERTRSSSPSAGATSPISTSRARVSLSFVRATVAHGRIRSVDLEQARAAPGVVAVYVHDDLAIAPMAPAMAMLNQDMKRPLLASGVVRHVGEPVVAIVSETREEGADAAELVVVDYDALPVVVDPESAREGEVLLFPELGTNLVLTLDFGSDESLFDGCEVVVRQRIVNQRIAPCPLEGRSAAARVGDDGRLEYCVSTQAPHGVLELARHRARPRAREGPRRLAGRRRRLRGQGRRLSRGDHRGLGGVEARPTRALDRDPLREHARPRPRPRAGAVRSDRAATGTGGSSPTASTSSRTPAAYPDIGAILPLLTRMMASGVYDIAKAECSSVSVVTNTTPTVAYRGAGRPEATAAIERMVDRFAVEIGMDPAEVRRRNFVAKAAFPFTTPTGTEYDVGDYDRTLELALEVAGYDDLRAEQSRRRATGDPHQLGIGLCSYVEITNGMSEGEYGAVEVRTDGKVIVRTGTSPHGQGHVTAWSMLVADSLGVAIEDIEVIHGDTDVVPRGVGTFGSRSLQTGGVAVHEAAAEVVTMARQLAADLLEAAPEDLVLDKSAGRFHVTGTPAVARTWPELAQASLERDGRALMAEVDFTAPGATFPFGTHVAVVDVDVETGKVVLLRHIAVDDAGRILNPLLAEGQVHGGIGQGAAQALLEEFVYDEQGNPLTGNLADYGFPSAAELPSYETRFTETPTPLNPLGAKGIGESGTIGSTPAVQNAVVDALAHLGVLHVDMPTTPERVWQAIVAAARPT